MSPRVGGLGFRSCRGVLEERRTHGEVGAVYLMTALRQRTALRAARALATEEKVEDDLRPVEGPAQAL